ncbi:hypothetical protein [Dactylosporangium sp. NPDC050588]|uniref:hypothetical protein n=1 Tax=Dactylosporangium sp. NPDC050588 TaxID=3157211 RepID=UPI0033DDBFE4
MTTTAPGAANALPDLDLRQLHAAIEDHADPHGTDAIEDVHLVLGDATNTLTLHLGDGSNPREAIRGALRLASLAGQYAVKLAQRLEYLQEAEHRKTWGDEA